MVYQFKGERSNIGKYLDKVIVVEKVEITEETEMALVKLHLDDGSILTTTSAVINKQAAKLKADGNVPFQVKICNRIGKSGFSYYYFSDPKEE